MENPASCFSRTSALHIPQHKQGTTHTDGILREQACMISMKARRAEPVEEPPPAAKKRRDLYRCSKSGKVVIGLLMPLASLGCDLVRRPAPAGQSMFRLRPVQRQHSQLLKTDKTVGWSITDCAPEGALDYADAIGGNSPVNDKDSGRGNGIRRSSGSACRER